MTDRNGGGTCVPAGMSPDEAYLALGRLADSHVGVRLFTLMAFDAATGEGRRFHSSMPDAYPVSGRKPIPDGPWHDTVIANRQVFAANTIEEIAEVFPDHPLIESLGCGAVLNIPVWTEDEMLGTINCLDRSGSYGPAHVRAAEDLRLPGLTCFLLERTRSKNGDPA